MFITPVFLELLPVLPYVLDYMRIEIEMMHYDGCNFKSMLDHATNCCFVEVLNDLRDGRMRERYTLRRKFPIVDTPKLNSPLHYWMTIHGCCQVDTQSNYFKAWKCYS